MAVFLEDAGRLCAAAAVLGHRSRPGGIVLGLCPRAGSGAQAWRTRNTSRSSSRGVKPGMRWRKERGAGTKPDPHCRCPHRIRHAARHDDHGAAAERDDGAALGAASRRDRLTGQAVRRGVLQWVRDARRRRSPAKCQLNTDDQRLSLSLAPAQGIKLPARRRSPWPQLQKQIRQPANDARPGRVMASGARSCFTCSLVSSPSSSTMSTTPRFSLSARLATREQAS